MRSFTSVISPLPSSPTKAIFDSRSAKTLIFLLWLAYLLKYLFSGVYLNKTFENCRIGGDRFSTFGSTALALVGFSVSSVSSVSGDFFGV